MIIIGVDPGTIITGYGIVEFTQNNFTAIEHGVIKLPASLSLPNKLDIIYKKLCELLELYRPDEFAINIRKRLSRLRKQTRWIILTNT